VRYNLGRDFWQNEPKLEVLRMQRVTASMALRLGKLCGNDPTLWLNRNTITVVGLSPDARRQD
jgi:hypothetical protein